MPLTPLARARPRAPRAAPNRAWLSKGEKEGANPLADPMAIAAIVGLVVPFTILAIGIASGYIEVQ